MIKRVESGQDWSHTTLLLLELCKYVYLVTLPCYLICCGTKENSNFSFEVLFSLFPMFYCNVTSERTICIIDSHFDSSLPNSGMYMYLKIKARIQQKRIK